MTKADPLRRFVLPAVLAAACVLLHGCGREVEVFPEPGGAAETSQIIRTGDTGVILVAFVSFPLRRGSPPDGIRAAVLRASSEIPCSAAVFFWSERKLAERWIAEQADQRRRSGRQPRLVLAGHGLGAAEAAETVRDLLVRAPDVQVALLLTVDAVKTSKLAPAAGVTGAMVNRIPGVNTSLAAYDAAPTPDGIRYFEHINYYQENSQLYHGAAMPAAENHRLDDWTGLLNHGNADDFAFPLILSDLRAILRRGLQ